MRTNNLLPISMLFFLVVGYAQGQTASKLDSLKVEIYTAEERDNLQYWFHEKVDSMGMTEDMSSKYFEVLTKYGYKIGRLNDKDKDFSKTEILSRFEALIKQQDRELQEFLSKDQFQKHNENYKEIIRSIKSRLEKAE